MANADAAFGAIPVNQDGSGYNGSTRLYNVDSSNGTAIFRGDFVVQEADGNVTPATAGAGNSILGVVVGVQIDPTVSETEHPGFLPATTAGAVHVVPADINPYFLIQEDSDGGALASADVGSRVDFVANAGDSNSGISGHEIDSSTQGTGTTMQLQLVEIQNRPDNSQGDFADWVVRINNPQHGINSAGV